MCVCDTSTSQSFTGHMKVMQNGPQGTSNSANYNTMFLQQIEFNRGETVYNDNHEAVHFGKHFQTSTSSI